MLLKKIIKFVVSGSLATGVDLILLYLFFDIWHWSLLVSSSIAFAIAIIVSFVLQKMWTFKYYCNINLFRQLGTYSMVGIFGLVVNAIFVNFMVTNLSLWHILAQLISVSIIGVINFFIYQFVIFKTYEIKNIK